MEAKEKQEIQLVENSKYNAISQNVLNQNYGDLIVKISIYVETRKKKDGTSYPYISAKGKYNIIENGEIKDKSMKWVDLHFTKEAFKKDCSDLLQVHTPDDLSTGWLFVKAKYVQKGKNYEVKEAYWLNDKHEKLTSEPLDENGNELEPAFSKNGKRLNVYPNMWIKGGVIAFQPKVVSQEDFEEDEFIDVKPEEAVSQVDFETGEIIESSQEE